MLSFFTETTEIFGQVNTPSGPTFTKSNFHLLQKTTLQFTIFHKRKINTNWSIGLVSVPTSNLSSILKKVISLMTDGVVSDLDALLATFYLPSLESGNN